MATTTRPQQSIRIGYDEKKKQYRKSVGTRLDKHGKPVSCQFWLGNDAQQALRLYRELVGYWEHFLRPAGEHWTPAHERRVRLQIRIQSQTAHAIQARLAAETEARLQPLVEAGWLTAKSTPPATPPPPPVHPPALCLDTAAQRFLDAARARQVSGKYLARCEQSLDLFYTQLYAATPLADLDAGRLTRVVAHFTARPTSRSTGRPMSVATIRTLFETARAVLETTEDMGWECRGWCRLFRVRWNALLTPAEQRRQALGKETFTFAELAGWEIVDDPPVKFLRYPGMLPLPLPEKGGSINELRDLVNLPEEHNWIMVVSWLLGTLRSLGPYPQLIVNGEQGSAKTTLVDLLRQVIDPNDASHLSNPQNEEDLMIAAIKSWIVSLDKVSWIDGNRSDVLCRLSTATAYSKRKLYTNEGQQILKACRPVLLNGIKSKRTWPTVRIT